MTTLNDPKLTIPELIARWRNGVTRGTLANWRSLGKGPKAERCGSEILYPLSGVVAYEQERSKGGSRWFKPGKPAAQQSENSDDPLA